jgi:hypothetical protein
VVFRWGREGIDFLQLGMLGLWVRSGLLDSGNRALPALPQVLHDVGLANTPTRSGAGIIVATQITQSDTELGCLMCCVVWTLILQAAWNAEVA